MPSDAPLAPPLARTLLDAADAVAGVLQGHRLAPLLAPAVQDLAYGCLRAWGRGDLVLHELMAKPPAGRLRALLLVALHRLEQRPEAAHTTVDQAVEAAGAVAGGRYKPLVNGVLRQALRQRERLLAALAADEPARLMHPAWWLARLRRDHPAHWEDIVAAGNSHPPMGLRVNRRRIGREDYAARLVEAGIAARPAGTSGLLLESPVPVSRLPGFDEGWVSVQDLGAQRAAGLLGAADGMRVLDACAAPGGKTAHLLESADLELTAVDLDPQRSDLIGRNLARLGLRCELRCADVRELSAWWDGRPYERVLADVPCSASGVVRRHPDAKWLRRPGDVKRFAAQQQAILDALWQVLAPDGKLLYATCSVFAEENQAQVDAFAARHEDCRRLALNDGLDCRLLPNAEHDGFYFALLGKQA